MLDRRWDDSAGYLKTCVTAAPTVGLSSLGGLWAAVDVCVKIRVPFSRGLSLPHDDCVASMKGPWMGRGGIRAGAGRPSSSTRSASSTAADSQQTRFFVDCATPANRGCQSVSLSASSAAPASSAVATGSSATGRMRGIPAQRGRFARRHRGGGDGATQQDGDVDIGHGPGVVRDSRRLLVDGVYVGSVPAGERRGGPVLPVQVVHVAGTAFVDTGRANASIVGGTGGPSASAADISPSSRQSSILGAQNLYGTMATGRTPPVKQPSRIGSIQSAYGIAARTPGHEACRGRFGGLSAGVHGG